MVYSLKLAKTVSDAIAQAGIPILGVHLAGVLRDASAEFDYQVL